MPVAGSGRLGVQAPGSVGAHEPADRTAQVEPAARRRVTRIRGLAVGDGAQRWVRSRDVIHSLVIEPTWKTESALASTRWTC